MNLSEQQTAQLAQHKEYLATDGRAGAKLDWSEANLRGADLSGANLRKANLHKADLSEANLRGADLREADLSEASLWGANLREADLSEANLREADLSGANLREANLREADLREASLWGANLREADLSEANLWGVNLWGANLSEAKLSSIKADVWKVLDQNPHEVPFLLLTLQEGRVNGSSYDKECACLFGTIAHAKQVDYRTLNGIDSSRPCEKWFLAIRKTKPSEHPVTAITEEWILEWQANQ